MSAWIAVGVFCALLLALRLIVLPQLESRSADIAHLLSLRIGQPVQIDELITGWDGWNPKLSIRGFRVRDAARGNEVLLELPRVDMLVAWTSVPLLDLRLKELLIEGPRLALRRDPAGRLHIAGIEHEAESSTNDAALAEWLMRQPQIVVRDALVVWNDEYRRAPQLILDHVAFRLVQRFGRHHAGLTGVPPAELAAPLELVADVTGHALNDWSQLEGRVYVRLDYADIAAWSEWLPIPVPVDSGKGAIRIWADFAHSQPTSVTADFELENVRTTLDKQLTPLEVSHVAGRAEWKRAPARVDFVARQLMFALPDGSQVRPTDLAMTLEDARDGRPQSGSLAFDEVEIRPIAAIVPHLPLPDALRQLIVHYAPRGVLQSAAIRWTGPFDALASYAVKADFHDVTVDAVEAWPGLTNVSGSADVTERGGVVHVASQGATLVAPKVFVDPIAFEVLRGNVSWQHEGDTTAVQVKDAAFANGDVTGTGSATWRAHPGGPGTIDLHAQLSRANIPATHRYLPRGVPAGVRDWLRRALVKGTSADGRLTLTGDLAQFPFVNGKGGQFVFAAKAQDGALHYSDRWPDVTDIAAEVRVEGTRLSVGATSARVLGAAIGPTRAEIVDFHAAQPVLTIDGIASGATGEFLAFIAKTPIAEWTHNVARDATAAGDGRLALKFDLPLHDPSAVTIDGEYRFVTNTLRLPSFPSLNAVNGNIAFTSHSIKATDISAEALGGPLKLQLSAESGSVRVVGAGAADLQMVRNEYPAIAMLDRVSGKTDWQLTLDASDQRAAWTIDSSLVGAAIDLPAPFAKPASDRLPLHVERRDVRATEDRIALTLGNNVRADLHRKIGAQAASVDRVLVQLGKAASEALEAEQPGVWVRGDVSSVNLDEWLALDFAAKSGDQAASDTLTLNGVDLTAGSLEVLGRTFKQLKSSARRQGDDWRLTLDGTELAGTAVWRTATAAQPNARLIGRLTRLSTPEASDAPVTLAQPKAATRKWPEVDLVADALRSKERTLGKLELTASPSGNDWQIRKLALVNDAGRIEANGSWRNAASRSQTALNVVVDIKEAGEFLRRFGWPNAVKGAATKIEGRLAWDGAPSDFEYASLSGNFKLNSGAGQFTRIDPGVGRLLGILSLQALPRRISLDFRDVFSEGFAFDTISADVRMDKGVMHTDAFRLVGPAATVNISGAVDLERETQELKVRVQPALSSGISMGTAALFFANPLVGAAVGAGTLLAQKILNNPVDQLFSYEYSVTGSFDDPIVARTRANTSTAAEAGAAAR